MNQQERQQQFLADFNAYHEALKAQYGYALTIAPVSQQVQTARGARVEIEMQFGLQEVAGWVQPEALATDTALTPGPSPKGEGNTVAAGAQT